jgi:hypothetical protein
MLWTLVYTDGLFYIVHFVILLTVVSIEAGLAIIGLLETWKSSEMHDQLVIWYF